MNKNRTTLFTIAEFFNVSPKTVSRALNDLPGVSKDLREKIKAKAEEYNYVPNFFGKGLKQQTSKTIGVVISDNTNPNYSYMIMGIERSCEIRGYNVIICNSREDVEVEDRYIEMLISKHVDGLIISSSHLLNEYTKGIKLLKNLNIPYVLVNRILEGGNDDFVKTDNILGEKIAAEYLIRKGHKDIIMLTFEKKVTSSIERLKGFQIALNQNGLKFDKKNIFYCDKMSIDDSYHAMKNILQARRDFTAILAFNDIMALGIIKAITEAGLKVPDDISVIGFDDIPFCDVSMVPLTTIHQDNDLIGRFVIDILLKKIAGEKKTCSQILVQPFLVERSSVKVLAENKGLNILKA